VSAMSYLATQHVERADRYLRGTYLNTLRYAYRDSVTGRRWVVDADALIDLGAALHEASGVAARERAFVQWRLVTTHQDWCDRGDPSGLVWH
jgi:hypothetical protein